MRCSTVFRVNKVLSLSSVKINWYLSSVLSSWASQIVSSARRCIIVISGFMMTIHTIIRLILFGKLEKRKVTTKGVSSTLSIWPQERAEMGFCIVAFKFISLYF